MRRGDEMRTDAEPSAVRILPPDGFDPTPPLPEVAKPPQRWFVPLLVITGILAVFLAATRPAATPGDTAALTTTPPSLSEINADQIDITTHPAGTSISGEWIEGTIDGTLRLNDFLRSGNSYVAIGSTPEGPNAWLSGNGIAWNTVVSLDVPDSAKISLDHAVTWQGNLVVLGSVDDLVGLWAMDRLRGWEFYGPVESIGTNWISNLTAGVELLAISDAHQTVQGWMSSDGLEWRPLGRLPLLEDAASIEALAATDGWYFAGGANCSSNTCSPVIYRSSDGLDWEPMAGDLPDRLSAGVGVVMDITTTADGLVAVGELDRHVAIWRSTDGGAWEQIAVEDAAFAHVPVVVEVLAIRTGDNPVATVSLNGIEYRVTDGSEILTDSGRIEVEAITDSYIIVGIAESRRRLQLNTPSELIGWSTAWQVVAEGPRLVLAGEILGDFDSSAVVWTSADSGETWDRTFTPANGAGSFDVAMVGQYVVALTSTEPDTSRVWRTTWDTTATGEAATATLGSYLDALGRYDAAALVALLPATNPGTSTPRFEIPSLGLVRHEWWDKETGALQPDKVADTVGYLRATNMAVDHGDCTQSVSLGATDRANVTCEFHVESDLLSTLGFTNGTGDIQAATADGELVSVGVNTSPSEAMWRAFSVGISGHTEEERAIVLAQDDSGAVVLAPIFNEATAATHISLAEEFVAGLLRPGETRIIDTALGTMEWTWLDQLDLPVFKFETVTWSRLGFLATARGATNQLPEKLSIWMSPDGVDWVETKAPDAVESIWGLKPFGDGVAGQGWTDGRPSIVVFDGDDWTVLDLPSEATNDQNVAYAGINEDRILAITGAWQDERGPDFDNAWIIDKDLALTEVSLPPVDDWSEINVGLAADDTGFILSAASFNSHSLSIWHTTDGFDWTAIAESAGIEDASYMWNLQQHRSQYFVVGEAMEMRCTPDGAGEICESAVGLWRSPDGRAWDRVLTQAGTAVSTYEIASGDLGLVAFGLPTNGPPIPRPVYLSADGQEWHQAGGLSMLHPDVDWWWINSPAVSGDTIIATGNGFRDGQDSDRPFLLVGRVLDGSS
ncbi:MAG: hypothetical protein GY788_25635 [bacterium]|nr:hypothetical protein [bacterium]